MVPGSVYLHTRHLKRTSKDVGNYSGSHVIGSLWAGGGSVQVGAWVGGWMGGCVRGWRVGGMPMECSSIGILHSYYCYASEYCTT